MKTSSIILIASFVVGISIIIIASNLQNYLFDPNFIDQPAGECQDISTIRTVSKLNIQTPTNLPQNFILHCGWADLYEVELLYADGIPASPPTRSDIPAKTQDGAIHIIVDDLKSKVGNADFQKEIGNVDDQIIKEFESVKKGNPSLNAQLVDINGKKALAYEPCKNCGKQTATFEDGTVINNSFEVPARIFFYDDTGKRYFLESNRPLSELIEVAGSLQVLQQQSGIPFNEIKCKQNLVLIQKYDGSPACVTEFTKQKLIERGWTKDDSTLSKINTSCMTLEQSKETAPFFKTPTYLPEGYSYVCSSSGMPFESYIVYHHKEIPDSFEINELVSDGVIFIYQVDEKNMVGDKEFQTYGSPEQRTRETYDSVIEGNPSLNPQLITINGMLAYAVDSCPDCGMQTANFTDGTSIQESTSTETRIKFIDENGVSYMLETTLPLSELIKVAESLQ